MKKNIWMVLAAASLMTACDYNEKYFEGFDETDQSNVQKYTVEYTEKTFKETESAKDVIIPWLTQKYYTCKKRFPDGVFVFIVPPSLDELSSRIYKRGTDSEEVIKKRLASATGELAYASEYDYIIVNDIAERATQKVLTVMEAERYRAARTYSIIDEICHCRKEE